MKATYINQQGDVDVLTYGDLPEPSLGSGNVLIRVRATALNHLGVFARAGRNGVVLDRFPHILGCDLAGEVAQVGAEVTGFISGDRVLADCTIRCGRCEACDSGSDQLCVDGRSIGISVNRGYGEYVSVLWTNVHAIPERLSFEEAASIPLVYRTAWYCLVTVATLSLGKTCWSWRRGVGWGVLPSVWQSSLGPG